VLTAWTQVGAERGVDQDAAAVDLPALRAELAARAPATAAACHRLVARFCNRAGVPTR
jgi:hypothetical protein